MTFVEFLEKAPLYQWFEVTVEKGNGFLKFVLPHFSAYCNNCRVERSFGNAGVVRSGNSDNFEFKGKTLAAICVCIHCHQFWRGFIIHFHEDGKRIMKAGQYPPWDLSIDRQLAKMLGEHKETFKKGFICEAQGYGIAAHAYYRRSVEMIIDELLETIEVLLEGEEKTKYMQILEDVKTTRQTSEKIRLVKDILPDTLRPEGYNPLGILYEALSEGIHDLSEDEGLKQSTSIRTVLVFLISQVQHHKDTTKKFTEGIRNLLEKKRIKSLGSMPNE